MNENTRHAEATPTKQEAGVYVAFTWGGNDTTSHMPDGVFRFVKTGSKWAVSHVDYTAEKDFVGQHPERRYNQLQPTLKAAHAFAEQIVRDLPNNVARRREAALRGAMPIGHSPIGKV